MSSLSASPPIEMAGRPVGRRTFTLIDTNRPTATGPGGRIEVVDVWYPAVAGPQQLTAYEPIPGIVFESANARDDAPFEAGRFPLILLSHGRTGMRFAYAMLAEALAARGAVVVAADHAGDVMSDWLRGTFVDDRTNEVNRVGDARFLIDTLLDPVAAAAAGMADVSAMIAADMVALVGHSYGAYTGLAVAAGVRGVAPDARVGAVVGLQPYTRSMSDAALARVTAPTLLILSEFDTTAPITTDGERPWQLITGRPLWRLDLHGAAHHASSDMGLYLELAGRIPDLPPMVAAYVAMMTPDMIGEHLRPWRAGLLLQLDAIWAFLQVTLGFDLAAGLAEAEHLALTPGIVLQRR
jgi:predicted dienelactone hydrolase